MTNGTWLVDPKTGERVAAVRDADGVARPINKPAPKGKTPKGEGE